MLENEKKPLVAVIILTYNRSDSLPEVIRSIVEQTYENLKILICDNASTDDTKEVAHKLIEKYQERRIEYFGIWNGVNINEGRNLTLGVARACGAKYVGILQDDNRYLQANYIKTAVQIMEEHLDVTYVAGRFYNGETSLRLWEGHCIIDGATFFRNWPRVWTFYPACVYRWEPLAGIRMDGTVQNGDSTMLLDLALAGSVALLDWVVVEDNFNKKVSYMSGLMKDPWYSYTSAKQYFRGAVDFAVKFRGNDIKREEAELWYRSRLSSATIEQISKINNAELKHDFIKRVLEDEPRIIASCLEMIGF